MRIAVHSASASVSRTLEAMIAASGHQFTAEGSADVVLVDTLHPLAKPMPAGEVLQLNAPTATSGNDAASLTCPIKPERLLQRLMMLANTQRLALANGWSLDMQARALQHETAASASFTEKECTLLKHLLHAHPTPLSRDDLLEQVWGMAGEIDTHTLETHIYRLRSKLDELKPRPCDILTQDGAYVLALNENPV